MAQFDGNELFSLCMKFLNHGISIGEEAKEEDKKIDNDILAAPHVFSVGDEIHIQGNAQVLIKKVEAITDDALLFAVEKPDIGEE